MLVSTLKKRNWQFSPQIKALAYEKKFGVMSLAALSDSQLSKEFKMESCTMSEPPKFEFDFWGCRVSAQGAIGIVAAVGVVAMLLAFYRF